jgi:hypothetical protein
MTDPAEPPTADDSVGPGGMPRWVKVTLIAVVALVALVVVANITGVAGEHGPGRHGGGDETPSSLDHNGGHQSPVDHEP